MSTLTLLPAPSFAADKPQALDAEFLEYLLSYEGKEDNWTVVAEGEIRERAREIANRAKKPQPAQSKPQESKP